MNREEKNLQTRQKILSSALEEFGEKSYGEASLNAICTAGAISKGIIYHYFKDKDELYLFCVRECFDTLTLHLEQVMPVEELSIEAALERYFDARIAFFGKHPLYLKLFCNVIGNPPTHLSADIDQAKAALDTQSVSLLTTLLKKVQLRLDITIEDVVQVFCEYQDFVNVRFQRQAAEEATLQEHEERCRRSLQILLYGVIEREE